MPRGVQVNAKEGERMRAGDLLMDGPLNPHDILSHKSSLRCGYLNGSVGDD